MSDYHPGDDRHDDYRNAYCKLSSEADGFSLSRSKFQGDLPDETITFPWNRLDKPRGLAFIAETYSQSAHQNVKAVFEFNITARPQSLLNHFAADQFSGSFEQYVK